MRIINELVSLGVTLNELLLAPLVEQLQGVTHQVSLPRCPCPVPEDTSFGLPNFSREALAWPEAP